MNEENVHTIRLTDNPTARIRISAGWSNKIPPSSEWNVISFFPSDLSDEDSLSSDWSTEGSTSEVDYSIAPIDDNYEESGFNKAYHDSEPLLKGDVVEFAVDRKRTSEASPFLSTMLNSREFADSGHETITLEETDDAAALLIILGSIHDRFLDGRFVLDRNTQNALKADEVLLWAVIDKAREFVMRIEPLQHWFRKWVEANPEIVYEQRLSMMFPYWQYDHPQLFQRLTHHHAYKHAGHINPKGCVYFDSLHLPRRIWNALNGARCHLRNLIHRRLLGPAAEVFEKADCTHKEKVMFAYHKALVSLGAYPPENGPQRKLSVAEILKELERFPQVYNKEKLERCRSCDPDWCLEVKNAIKTIREEFQGLCIDCLEVSRVKASYPRDKHWLEWGKAETWNIGCRVEHGENSWFWSFVGSYEEREGFIKIKRGYMREAQQRLRRYNPYPDEGY